MLPWPGCKYAGSCQLSRKRWDNLIFGKRGFKVFQVAGNHLIITYPCFSPGIYPSYQTSNGREWCTDPQTGWRVTFNFFRLIYSHILTLGHREYKNDFFVCRKVSNAVDASKKCCLDSSRLPSLDLWGPQALHFIFLLLFACFYLCLVWSVMFPPHRVTPSSSADMGRRTPVTLARSRWRIVFEKNILFFFARNEI